MTIVTQDLSRFGYRELTLSTKLLQAYAERAWASHADGLGENVVPAFNTHSGLVFLGDEDYNAAVLNDEGRLENWLYCTICGEEGLRSEVAFFDDTTCQNCIREEAKSILTNETKHTKPNQ